MNDVKTYIHARLNEEDRAVLESLKKSTGCSESELVRRGLRRIMQEILPKHNALEVAGNSAGKFKKGPRDLASNKKHLDGFGR
jgi:hypothetical protein